MNKLYYKQVTFWKDFRGVMRMRSQVFPFAFAPGV